MRMVLWTDVTIAAAAVVTAASVVLVYGQLIETQRATDAQVLLALQERWASTEMRAARSAASTLDGLGIVGKIMSCVRRKTGATTSICC